MVKLLTVFITLFLFSCFEKGYNNANGLYVPKKPNYKLKNREFIYPLNLEINSLYILEEMSYDNKLIFAFKKNIWPDYSSNKNWVRGIVFLGSGRCLGINLPIKNQTIEESLFKQDMFDPEKNHKEYFYFDGQKITIESFVYGTGSGQYVYFDYKLLNSGDTLVQEYKLSKSIYLKYHFPKYLNSIKLNW